MSPPRASLVVSGQVLVAARPDGIETAEAVGIADGRVVSVGSLRDVQDAAASDARLVREPASAIIPGIHDFHLHLIGLARARQSLDLSGCRDFDELVERVRSAASVLGPSAWLRGEGWTEAMLDPHRLASLASALSGRPALLKSHDRHSAWASPLAVATAGITEASSDPAGGRVERDTQGHPNGILRERTADLVADVAGRIQGDELRHALDGTVNALAALGITGATDAGDPTAANGVGPQAGLGDSFSSLVEHRGVVDRRLRLTLDLPEVALPIAAEQGLRTGQRLPGTATLRIGWAKVYADGALGSRTAALDDPYTCGPSGELGILRVAPAELDRTLRRSRRAGFALAIHAIGDRAVATVLDAMDRADARSPHVVADRMEHLQLIRAGDEARFAPIGITASLQPIHCASDRASVEACWGDRTDRAYAWRTLARAGTLLAFGSDAPVESVNPWHGLFAAVHRRFPSDATPDWCSREALDPVAALSAYTLGPARAAGREADEGHLRLGARADLAVLNVDLPTILAGDERLAGVEALVTMVDGRETYWR